MTPDIQTTDKLNHRDNPTLDFSLDNTHRSFDGTELIVVCYHTFANTVKQRVNMSPKSTILAYNSPFLNVGSVYVKNAMFWVDNV
jgi:hypothetical protein